MIDKKISTFFFLLTQKLEKIFKAFLRMQLNTKKYFK